MKKLARLNEIGRLTDQLYKDGKLEERNKLAAQWRKLRREIDYGFRVGDEVEYHKSKYVWERGKILSISASWQIEFKDLICPVEMIRRIKPVEEQLSFFE